MENVEYCIHNLKLYSGALHFKVNTFSSNGLAYIDGKMWSVAENKNMFLKQNTTRLFSINSCAILIKPFVWAAQAGTF